MAKAKSAIRIVADTTRAASLELAPLLKPHKRHGKLLIRVERMQRFARLSHGHNNGDGSWSLATDELEDLEYLVPEGTQTAHTLEVRIVAIDHGTTVATVEVPITLEDFKPVPEGGSGAVADTLTRQQRADFEALKISLAERDAELSSLRGLIQQAESELPAKIESAMTLARDGWSAELEKLLTTANSQARAELEKTREAWLADQNAHASRSEEKVTQARETLQRETENAIAAAENTWKAAETARFAKAEADWRIASEKLAVELKAKCERAETELARARAEVDEIRKAEQSGMRHVREDLAHARADAAKREQEATELRKALRDAEAAWTKAEGERLAKAQTSWREGADKIADDLKTQCERAEKALAEATAQSEQHRKLGATEQARVKDELANLREALAKRDRDLAERQNALQKAEDDHPRKMEASLAAARESWKKELEQHLAQAGAQFSAEIEKRKTAWLADQNVLLADAKKAADEHLEAERERLSREAKDTRTQAEATWKAAESARLAKAELEWRERSSRVETELKARSERAEAALAAAQSGADKGAAHDQAQAHLLEDLAKARMELAERDGAVADLKKALQLAEADLPAKVEAQVARARESAAQELAQRRESWEREAASARAEVEAQWKDAEAGRLSRREAEWREQSDSAMAALKTRCERAEAQLADTSKKGNREDHGRLIDELAIARTQLNERATELAKARAEIGEAVERQRKESDAALAKAKDEWIDAELERLSAAETQWRKHSDELLAIATTRCEKAENELAQLRAQPEGERATETDMVVGRLHDKIALLQRTLSERDRELAVLRMTKEPSDFAQKSRITLQRDLRRDADNAMPVKKPNSNRLARDIALVGAFAVLAVVLWPQVEPLLPDSVLSMFSSSSDTDDTEDVAPAPAKPAHPVAAAPAPPSLPTASIARSANMHADPSKSSDIVETIARGAKVTVIGQHGNWTDVRIESADGKSKPQEGWVYNTYLSAPPAEANSTPSSPQSATKP